MEEVIELTQRLVQIESTNPGAYESEISRFIEEWLRSNAFVAKVEKEEVLPGRFNVRSVLSGDASQPALVYICHQDTVVIGEDWGENGPLSGNIVDGKLYGRGACDMKSGLACGMMAVKKLAEKVQNGEQLTRDFIFIATMDEEDFMVGVEQAITSQWVKPEDWVLDAEPTDGEIRMAHKGRTWMEITVKGVTAHASTPEKGADANLALAKLMVELEKYFQTLPTDAKLGQSTVTFGKIEGGYRPYVVPDRSQVWLDMRLVPPTHTEIVKQQLQLIIKKIEQQQPGIGIRYQLTGDRPPIPENSESPFLHTLKQTVYQVTQQAPNVGTFTGYTDTAVIASKLGNCNCLSYGPGNLELAHKPNEYVPLVDILRCQGVLEELAVTCCLSPKI